MRGRMSAPACKSSSEHWKCQPAAENSAVDGGILVAPMSEGTGNEGFDAGRKQYIDLIEAGIVDSTKVVRIVLENAVSVASVRLLTEDHDENSRGDEGARAAAKWLYKSCVRRPLNPRLVGGCRRCERHGREYDVAGAATRRRLHQFHRNYLLRKCQIAIDRMLPRDCSAVAANARQCDVRQERPFVRLAERRQQSGAQLFKVCAGSTFGP